MPALAPITLNNGSTDNVYTPVTIDKNGVAIFRDQSSGIPVGYPSLTHSISEPASNAASGVYRVRVQLAVPRLNVVSPADETKDTVEVDGTTRCHIEFLLPVQGPKVERSEIIALLAAAIANQDIKDSVQNIEHFY